MIINKKHEYTTQQRGYIYIGTYEVNEMLKDSNKNRKTSVPIMRIKCPYCSWEYDIRVTSFKHSKSKCVHCCNKYENSFAYYIQQILQEPLNKYWDWETNAVNPYLIAWGSADKVKIKVNNKTYITRSVSGINIIKRSLRPNKKVNLSDSFAQYHINNTDKDFLEKYWSDKNTLDPWKISPSSNKTKVIIKDLNGKEKLISCNRFTQITKNRKSIVFKTTISFAQWGIDNIGDDFLEKYWSDKNEMNPYEVSYATDTKIWIKCNETDYHDDYFVSTYKFARLKRRCPQCSHKGNSLHPKDSFGALYPNKTKYWSKRNKKSPFELYPHSREKGWFICEKCNAEFNPTMEKLNYNLNNDNNVLCNKCKSTKGESKIINYLNFVNISYIYDEPYFDDLLSPKGNPLRPDFILPDLKIWIEYDGEFHFDKLYENDGHDEIIINDGIKNEYAKLNGWKLIRIPYWEFDNIENILMNEINKLEGLYEYN